MQLFAYNTEGYLIAAKQAVKHVNYTCLECGSCVRVRRGMHRQTHYYHRDPNRSCRLNGKSMEHLMLQHHLKKIVPEVFLEHRFETINRIADVAWHEKNLVFEIQCSPITAQEIMSRNHDYQSLGYHVIWIFHDKRYNQYRLSAAEDSLKKGIYYFSDMNAQGEGKIYDQLSWIHRGVRRQRFVKSNVDLSQPIFLKSYPELQTLPPLLLNRTENALYHFNGDSLWNYLIKDPLLCGALEDFFQDKQRVNRISPTKETFVKLIVNPYKALLRLVLERMCR